MKTHVEMLMEMGVAESDSLQYIADLEDVLPRYGIAESRQRLAHFFAQVLHESGLMRFDTENLNYSAKALRAVFGKYFKTDEQAADYARQPERIASRVYANRMGNGSEASGDGWRYRGRGLLQLTGKDNYQAFANWPSPTGWAKRASSMSPIWWRRTTPCIPPLTSGTETGSTPSPTGTTSWP